MDENSCKDSNKFNLKYWNVIVVSDSHSFNQSFIKSSEPFFSESVKLKIAIYSTNLNQNSIWDNFNSQTIIHIDCSNKTKEWLSNLVSAIRNSNSCLNAFVTAWYNQNWDSIPTHLLRANSVNEIRTTSLIDANKVKHVVYSNIQNQKQLLELINLKANLEEIIEERTNSLTELNKDLQSAIIQNSTKNSKLQQQKLQIEKQIQENQIQNKDLEKAFKKSSRQHIRLHKLLLENETQRKDLEKALVEIKENNDKLQLKNEEIISQNEHIDQQREEIQAQRDMAIKQHNLIQEHQGEINENITYARRIQNAMLTPEKQLKQLIPKHFVLNKPKDIVSGDFFWVTQNLHHTVIAVADCTGHGISGAMMSMLGIAFLNEIVNNNGIIKSNEILEQLRKRIILSLHQEFSHDISFSRDGMDISVVVIDIMESKLEYSGANNPIYIIRNNQLLELSPDKMPIGIHEFFNEPFKSEEFNIEKEDTLYMFSDGYADQFGGKKGHKLKYTRFKNLLLETNKLPIEEQKEHLANYFDAWKGENDQIDDVIVLGYKFIG